MNQHHNDQADAWHIDWTATLPRRPGQPPRVIVQPVARPVAVIHAAPLPTVDQLALDPSDRRSTPKKTKSLTWTIVKAGLIVAVLVTLAPPLFRLLVVGGLITFAQLNK